MYTFSIYHLTWEFKKPLIISFITLHFIQLKINELVFTYFQYHPQATNSVEDEPTEEPEDQTEVTEEQIPSEEETWEEKEGWCNL